MHEVNYEKDFCRERCVFYKRLTKRLEGYNLPELVKQQEQKISPYCEEHCTHTREEFNEWRRAKKFPSLVKRLFGME